ncbi:MAG: hypothetical protein JAZ16_07585 [Candidatus Thiodiazotropha taylori]|nr:hypothetical protein [Candidatus Thiodiazotropha taylori]
MTDIKYEDVTEEYKWYAESVGKGVRAMALGTIGAIWAVLSADGVSLEDTALFGFPSQFLVKLAFVFASAALLSDLLQGITAFWMYHLGLEKWEKQERNNEEFTFAYDREHLGLFGILLYWSNTAFFPIKLILAIMAGATFVCLAFAVTLN